MYPDRCGNTSRQKFHGKGSRKETKIQEFMYRDIINMEHEMYDYASNNRGHQNSNKRFKENFGSHTQKTFNRFTTKDGYTWTVTYNMEYTAT